jgi:hypothetical protein
MKNPNAPVAAFFSLLLLAGCAALPKHELEINEAMRSQPVSRVFVMPPYFAPAIRRIDPGDYRQMLPENQKASSEALKKSLENALGASLTVDSAWVPGPAEADWAGKIGGDLAIGRVALGVPSVTCPVESVLITGVVAYGTEKDQVVITPLPFLPGAKPKVIGGVRWDHVTDLEVMLVRPSDGKVLFTLRHDERLNTGYEDSVLLEESAARAAAAVAKVFEKAAEKNGTR